MKQIITFIIAFISVFSFAQEKDKAELLALKKANNYVYEGNALAEEDNFISAEMEYRKAISENPTTITGTYNLGTTYIGKGNFDEALYRLEEATKTATSKTEKHKAFHNIGNILMQNKKCKEAVEAYKNALRNNPTDDETRYNLGLAKICAEQQQDQEDQNKDENKEDKKDDNKENEDEKENQDNKDKEGDKEEDKKDEGDQEKKEGDDEKDEEGKPKDEKEGKGDEEKKKDQQKPKPQPGQLSPQQIKNLLEAMNNQEQKVQEKMNAEKQKGVKIKTDKDW
ncbi:tetratricopeptide repeat protein [Flaviramulus sp. BrNp1-15]|uniref:tetratricopeptide repeat protein n=1 Tax=Flaviramulus sp. BrNp1-15 TaxID=2916754 RepID=UPI001EE84F80|nr:tetratricopeptide repeat protein [Flaviramulus sp. BrNp1-15]ULC59592.1 tetratricopeptide repeat protein [Flaviramulus sp. BrNp1-15]